MKVIELTSYETNDLRRTLEYAIDKKKEDCNNGKITEKRLMLDIENIRCLLARIPKEYIEKKEEKKYKRKIDIMVDNLKKQKEKVEKEEENIINIFE